MPSRQKDSSASAVPQKLAVTLPPGYPAPSHDFTLQAVMHMQETLGKLTEAVDSLKEQSKAHDTKLDAVVKDVHGAKVAGKALLWVVGVVGTLLGILLSAYFKGYGPK